MMLASTINVAVLAAAQPAIMKDASRPALQYDCTLIVSDKRQIHFAFRATGGQMIVKDGATVGYSPRKVEVTADSAKLVEKFPDHYHSLADDYDGHFKHGFGWNEGRSFKTGMELSAQEIAGRNKASITINDGYYGSFAAAGLCDVTKTPQHAVIENSK